VGLWRGFKFSVSYRASKLSFKAFSSRRSSLNQTFVESCVDFEVDHFTGKRIVNAMDVGTHSQCNHNVCLKGTYQFTTLVNMQFTYQ